MLAESACAKQCAERPKADLNAWGKRVWCGPMGKSRTLSALELRAEM